MATKILICHDSLILRTGLRSIIESEDEFEVVETTDSGLHAIMLVRSLRPDVIITGLNLHGMAGLELVFRFHQENLEPSPRMVVFAISPRSELLADMLNAQVHGLLTEESSREEIVVTIRAAARGETGLPPKVIQHLVAWFRRQAPASPGPPALAELTARERQVLLLVAQGQSTEEIARTLFIGVSTVRTHLHRLRAKLGCRDRAQLVSFAYETGLMTSRNPDESAPSRPRAGGY
jgi:DNA-binding NarL/FixJ family response regulator